MEILAETESECEGGGSPRDKTREERAEAVGSRMVGVSLPRGGAVLRERLTCLGLYVDDDWSRGSTVTAQNEASLWPVLLKSSEKLRAALFGTACQSQ